MRRISWNANSVLLLLQFCPATVHPYTIHWCLRTLCSVLVQLCHSLYVLLDIQQTLDADDEHDEDDEDIQ